MHKFSQCPKWKSASVLQNSSDLIYKETLNSFDHYYCSQTKFAKVMFSQVYVCPRGVSTPFHAGIHTPWDQRQASPLGRHPLADTLLGRHPPGRHPPMQCTLGYGQQAGGTHSTGMHSCFNENFNG